MVAPTKRLDVNGVTAAELVTIDNTDLDSVIVAVAGEARVETTSALRGSKGVRVTGAATDVYAMHYTDTAAASASVQVYFRANATPTVNWEFLGIRSAAANMGRLYLNTAGEVKLQSAVADVAWSGGVFAITNGVTYRCQVQVTKGTTTGNGTLIGQIYDDSDVLVRSATTSTANTGTADATNGRFGKPASAAAGVDGDMDEFAFITGTTAEIDPAPLNTTPQAGLDQVVDPFVLVTLIGLDAETVPDWTQTGGSPTVTFLEGSGATRTFISPATRAGTTLTFTLDDGQGLTDTMNVVVYPHNEWALISNVEEPMQLLKA